MTLEGRIVAVMESWPLQMVVETPAGRWHVALDAATEVTQGGRSLDPSELKPDLPVRVDGLPSNATAMTARAIELL
jgi:hypothetical protein